MRTSAYLLIALLSAPVAAFAQHAGDAPAPSAAAAAEAKQFDFLLGQWELDVKPKVNGLAAMIHGTPTLVGTWKAWRVLDGLGVEDEMRIVDKSGNPLTLARSLRVYSSGEARWKICGVDAYHARSSEASGRQQEGEMRIEGHFIDGEGKTTLTRTRYFDIRTDGFRMLQDRSADNGQTWDEAVLTIEAKRSAAAASP